MILLFVAVVFSGRNAIRQVRVLSDPERHRDFDRTVAANVAPLERRVPRSAVVRFPLGHERHDLLAQLRLQLVPRRVVVAGGADYEVVPVSDVSPDAPDEVVGEIDAEFVLRRAEP